MEVTRRRWTTAVLALCLMGWGCSDSSDDDSTGQFSVTVDCGADGVLDVPQTFMSECDLLVEATGGATGTITAVELIDGSGAVMTDFDYGSGISLYTDPTPDNLAGVEVSPSAPLEVALRVVADLESPVATYDAAIRVRYTVGGQSYEETRPFEFTVLPLGPGNGVGRWTT